MKTYHQDGNHRKSAFSGLQKDYEAARPQYPLAALELIKQHCRSPSLICDIGCGTGKLTRQLGALYPNTEILGFDINADMVSAAKNAGGAGICYAVCPAEDLPLAQQSADIITVAQAVHWFDRPAFFRESLRILSTRGVLFLIENNRNWKRSVLLAGYEDLLEELSPNYSRLYRGFDGAGEAKEVGFSQVSTQRYPWVRKISPKGFEQMARSSTHYQAALKANPEATEAALNALLSASGDADGQITVEYEIKIIAAAL
ncbi:MAG: class I SAM-dependent methyltransferase [Paracoccaceae bacterium]